MNKKSKGDPLLPMAKLFSDCTESIGKERDEEKKKRIIAEKKLTLLEEEITFLKNLSSSLTNETLPLLNSGNKALDSAASNISIIKGQLNAVIHSMEEIIKGNLPEEKKRKTHAIPAQV